MDVEATADSVAKDGDSGLKGEAEPSQVGAPAGNGAGTGWSHLPQKPLTHRVRPRCLIWGFDWRQHAQIRQLFAESKVISSLDEVHQDDWDLVVASGENVGLADPHLFVVAFGGSLITPPNDEGVVLGRSYFESEGEERRSLSRSSEFNGFVGTPPAFDALVKSDLLPKALAEGEHSVLAAYPVKEGRVGKLSLIVPGITPLLVGSDGAAIAATFDRSPKAKCLTLPPDASLEWITAAMTEWHKVEPKIFPEKTNWTNSAIDWLTPDELVAAGAALAADAQKDEADAKAKAAWGAFLEARQAAEAGMWRLLTANGAPLEEAVATALRDLGFAVREMDAEWPQGQRFEDLRVTCAERVDWEAIVEIKGYARSRGKAEDITNLLSRFGKNFHRTEGRFPSANWYVVNHDLETSPEERKPVLGNSEYDLAILAADDGLAIDSVDLYRLWRDAKMGRIGFDEARAKLIDSKGRFAHAWAPELTAS